jgi:hypothetical protein
MWKGLFFGSPQRISRGLKKSNADVGSTLGCSREITAGQGISNLVIRTGNMEDFEVGVMKGEEVDSKLKQGIVFRFGSKRVENVHSVQIVSVNANTLGDRDSVDDIRKSGDDTPCFPEEDPFRGHGNTCQISPETIIGRREPKAHREKGRITKEQNVRI